MNYAFSLLALLLTLLSGSISTHVLNGTSQESVISESLITPVISPQQEAPSFDNDVLLVDVDEEVEEPAGSCERPLFIAFYPTAPINSYDARAPPIRSVV